MKGIYLNLPDDVYAKVEEIANEKGHLTKTAAIRLMIMDYGTFTGKRVKAKPQKQDAVPEKKKQTECDICGQESDSLKPVLFDGEKVLACELCLSDEDLALQ